MSILNRCRCAAFKHEQREFLEWDVKPQNKQKHADFNADDVILLVVKYVWILTSFLKSSCHFFKLVNYP